MRPKRGRRIAPRGLICILLTAFPHTMSAKHAQILPRTRIFRPVNVKIRTGVRREKRANFAASAKKYGKGRGKAEAVIGNIFIKIRLYSRNFDILPL